MADPYDPRGPAGVGLVQMAGSNPLDPTQALDYQMNYFRTRRLAGGVGGRYGPAALDRQTIAQRAEGGRALHQEEEAKRRSTGMLTALNSLVANRGVPAYNMHEQAGRTGLVDPSLTQQDTPLPVPFSRQYDLQTNYQAYMKILPKDMYDASEGIDKYVQQLQPLAQQQLVHRDTIYEKFPNNFIINRSNIALQNKRVNSLYAVV